MSGNHEDADIPAYLKKYLDHQRLAMQGGAAGGAILGGLTGFGHGMSPRNGLIGAGIGGLGGMHLGKYLQRAMSDDTDRAGAYFERHRG